MERLSATIRGLQRLSTESECESFASLMRKNYPGMHEPQKLGELQIDPIAEYRECIKDFQILLKENMHARPYGCKKGFVAYLEMRMNGNKAGLIADLTLKHLIQGLPLQPKGANPEE